MGDQHLFYRDLGGGIQHIWYNDGFKGPDVWNQSVPNAPRAKGDPAAMVTSKDTHLFYRDHDDWIQHIWWDGKFFGPDIWNQQVGGVKADGDPAAMSSPGEQHLFYRDKDGWIQHIVYDGELHEPDQWNRQVDAPPAVGAPAAMSSRHDQHLFYRDDKDLIQHIWWDGEFHGPDQWNTLAGGPPADGDPAAMSLTAGGKDEQHLFYRDKDGWIQHIWWVDGSFHRDIWNRMLNLPLAKGDPTVMHVSYWRDSQHSSLASEQHLFYRDVHDQFQHIVWDGRFRKPDVWADGTKAKGDPAAVYSGADHQDNPWVD